MKGNLQIFFLILPTPHYIYERRKCKCISWVTERKNQNVVVSTACLLYKGVWFDHGDNKEKIAIYYQVNIEVIRRICFSKSEIVRMFIKLLLRTNVFP